MTVATICHACGTITNQGQRGYCPTCKPAHERQRNQQPTRRAHRTTLHRTITRIVQNRDPNQCAICQATDDLTIDYIIPLIHGGRQHSSNARILCRSCNSSKGAR